MKLLTKLRTALRSKTDGIAGQPPKIAGIQMQPVCPRHLAMLNEIENPLFTAIQFTVLKAIAATDAERALCQKELVAAAVDSARFTFLKYCTSSV
jgi:hypothetical protein